MPEVLRLRATTRIHNDHIRAFVRAPGWTMKRLAKEAGLSLERLYALARLDYSGARPETLRRYAEAIGAIIGADPDQIVPPELAGQRCDTVREMVADVPLANLLASAAEDRLGRHDPIQIAERSEDMDGVRDAMTALNDKERDVIRLRFGLDGEREHHLKEAGAAVGVTQERVRQIEARAVRKLQRKVYVTRRASLA